MPFRTKLELDTTISNYSNNPNPVVIIKKDGLIEYANPASDYLLGFIKCKSGDYLPEYYLYQFNKLIEKGGNVNCELKAGELIYQITIVPGNGEHFYAFCNDITHFKLTQNKLKESDERYRMLAEFARDIISRHDEKGNFLYVSPASNDILGYAFEELVGRSLIDFVDPQDRINISRELLSPEKISGVVVFRVKTKTGELVWMESKFKKFFNQRFLAEEWVIVSRDVTERILMEKKLFESEAKYRSIVETGQDFIYTADAQGNFTYMNPIGLKKIGYSEEEIIGKNFRILVREDWRERVVQFYNNIFHKKIIDSYLEFPVVSKNGEEWWVAQNVHMFEYKNWISGFQAYAREITERKAAEEELKKQQELTNSILDNLPFNIFLKNRSGKYLFMNKQALSFLGLKNEQVEGKNAEEVYSEEIKEIVTKGDDAAWKYSYYFGEESFNIKSKTAYFLTGKMILRFKNYDEPLLLGFNIDITQRKKIENELLKTTKQLEESVQAKEKFISIMSHEIRTPMNAVVGITNLLLQQEKSSDQLEYLNALKISSENLLKILNNVLDLSKIESGRVAFEKIDFNIVNNLKQVKELFAFPASEKHIQIDLKTDKRIPIMIKGDPYRLNQVLVNLMSNAIKFTEEGNIALTTELVKESKDHINILFSVTDSGIGIAEDKIAFIFESFTQADSNITRKYGGTGLGLTITKKLIELMGGEIRVESKLGHGSKFFFELQFEKAKSDDISETATEKWRNKLAGLKVLVVEDNKMNQLIISKFLEKENVSADITENGKQAIERLEKNKYDIVLMDLQMPEMDGYETSQFIRKELRLEIPIIAFTASSSSDIEAKVREAGMNDCIVKPFEPSLFYYIIAKYTHKLDQDIKSSTQEKMSETTKIIDLAYLRDASGGNESFVKEMVEIFLRQTPIYLNQLEELSSQYNWDDFRKIIHKLKPTIAMMGIREGQTLVKDIETNVKSGFKLDTIPSELQKLRDVCERSYSELMEVVKK